MVNNIRMHFGLNVKDAATAAWKIVKRSNSRDKDKKYPLNSSFESMLDAYHRAYPQHEFIQWVVKETQSGTNFYDLFLLSLELNFPEALSFIQRKSRLKAIKAE